MINTKYKLVSPRNIETVYSNVDLNKGEVLVCPEKMSVCKADIRYYYGMRHAGILRKKLPLVLIHECVGIVVYSGSSDFKTGDKVILLPNVSGESLICAENYREDSKFMSSDLDGFMQEIISVPEKQLIQYEEISGEAAVLTEFVSVAVHAVSTCLEKYGDFLKNVAVWGDGGLGYLVSSLLKHFIPEVRLSVVGTHKHKLELFRFADALYTVDELDMEELKPDCIFECVGGEGAESAITQMLEKVRAEGIIFLLGVSENPVSISTRTVLEKGITLIGRSRSGRKDFEMAYEIIKNDKKFRNRILKIVSEVIEIKQTSDIDYAFERSRSADFKIILDWKI